MANQEENYIRCYDRILTPEGNFVKISRWTSSDSIECADGSKLEDKLNDISGITSDLNCADEKIAASAKSANILYKNANALSARVDQCFQSASNGKALVAAAISGKGISTAANATYQQMANNIGQIETSSNGALNFTCSGGDSHTEHHGSFKVYNAKKIIVNSVSARNDMKKEVRWSSNFGFNYSDSSRTIDKSFGTEYNTSGINPVTININGNCGNDSSISIHAYY